MADFIIDNIELSPQEIFERGEHVALMLAVIKKSSTPPTQCSIVKKSIDARKRNNVIVRYRLLVSFSEKDSVKIKNKIEFTLFAAPDTEAASSFDKPFSALIVGSGPAGLFCALRLIQAGAQVTIIERGKSIDKRDADVSALKNHGTLDAESNILFGEGGAGTYSDGKLTSRIHKGPIEYFFNTMKEYGAPENILYDSKPHVGTDVLSVIVRRMRAYIEQHGTIHFGERADGLVMKNDSVIGVRASSGAVYTADAVIIATGHSARDTYQMLNKVGVECSAKGFAIGVRVEHPAQFINTSQYGPDAQFLSAADYRLTWTDPASKRGVYSFCMCPGGEVINSSSEDGMLCVNGMSLSTRNSAYSNAAVVVSVHPEDFGSPLDGIALQQFIEKNAFSLGGGGFFAPVQTISSFIRGESDGALTPASYHPGVRASLLSSAFPPFITEPLQTGLARFDRMIPGFIKNGLCIGAETRTSSPIRIVRDDQFQSVSHKGLFPIGEGAGYAGGITSSAVDGIRCAEALINRAKS
jgi:uncharacterized protein